MTNQMCSEVNSYTLDQWFPTLEVPASTNKTPVPVPCFCFHYQLVKAASGRLVIERFASSLIPTVHSPQQARLRPRMKLLLSRYRRHDWPKQWSLRPARPSPHRHTLAPMSTAAMHFRTPRIPGQWTESTKPWAQGLLHLPCQKKQEGRV